MSITKQSFIKFLARNSNSSSIWENPKLVKNKTFEELKNDYPEAFEDFEKQEYCENHDWHWNYDCFEDACILELDTLGIPVKCYKCGKEAIEMASVLILK